MSSDFSKKIKVAIIDDSVFSITAITKILENKNDIIEITFTSSDANEALIKLAKYEIDILFLDIEMPLLNGFEILEKIGQYTFQVVFTTAHENYALKAFKIHAFDYLIKPIDKFHVEDVINRFLNREKNISEIETSEIHNQKPESKVIEANGRLIIDTHGKTYFINISNIFYLKAERVYSKIIYDEKSVLVSKSTNYFENILQNLNFFRTHRSYLVNLNQVKDLLKKNNSSFFVRMKNLDEIILSRQHKKEFLEKMKSIN
ncbi:MAG: response regulator transcription factor [Bacteroidetes bacterium]|nr:response regulator transcription factor [Bacteroidota bacterium]